jgi:hypothetical protein
MLSGRHSVFGWAEGLGTVLLNAEDSSLAARRSHLVAKIGQVTDARNATISMLAMFISSAIVPVDTMPGWLQPVARPRSRPPGHVPHQFAAPCCSH